MHDASRIDYRGALPIPLEPMSSAFDHIHDPRDPAWIGHCEPGSDRSRALIRAGSAAVLCIAVIALGTVVLRSGPTGVDQVTFAPSAVRPAPSSSVQLPSVQLPPSGSFTHASVDIAPTAVKPLGSGWAPLEATIAPEDRGSGLVRGDLSGVSPQILDKLDILAVKLNRPIEIISGWRTRHEQEQLYSQFQAGTGNVAAVPGTSMHEIGQAADAYMDGVGLADAQGVAPLAAQLGLVFPVPGEAWHVEQQRAAPSAHGAAR